jgi:hypothetical protein
MTDNSGVSLCTQSQSNGQPRITTIYESLLVCGLLSVRQYHRHTRQCPAVYKNALQCITVDARTLRFCVAKKRKQGIFNARHICIVQKGDVSRQEDGHWKAGRILTGKAGERQFWPNAAENGRSDVARSESGISPRHGTWGGLWVMTVDEATRLCGPRPALWDWEWRLAPGAWRLWECCNARMLQWEAIIRARSGVDGHWPLAIDH